MKKLTAMPHQGRNVKRIREMLGIKQDALAVDLGLSQQAVSALEQKEELDAAVLEKVAKVLNVPEEAIKNFSEETAVNIISNTFTDFKDNASGINYNCDLNFNPLDKLLELFEENKKLYQEKNELYERMLQSDREKVEMLQKLLDKK